jgi:hypothetical protein
MLFSPLAHKRRERGVRLRGEALENKMQTKIRNKNKRVCSDGKEVLFTWKKKATMMKKATMTIVVPTSYTQERTKGSKTTGGNTIKKLQAKTKSKTTITCDDGEKVLLS